AVPAHQAGGDDVVFEVEVELAVLVDDQLEEVEQVAGVQCRGVCWYECGQVGVADDGHAVPDHHAIGFGQRAVAALGGGQVDDHRTGLHGLHGRFLQQHRG